MEIENLVIEKCIELFEQVRKVREEVPTTDSRVDYGVPPKAMLIQFGKGIIEKADFRLTDIEKAWYYSDGILSETDLTREWITEPRSGMYHAEALAEFTVEEGTKRVWLNYCFGPLYARGVSFLVEQQDGSLKLCDEKLHWVS